MNKTVRKKQKPAFSLAEILVALIVLGTISILSIPALINGINDDQYKTLWKKDFSDFSIVSLKLMQDNNGTFANLRDTNGTLCGNNGHDCFRDKYLPYLQILKVCNVGVSGCFTSSGSYFDKTSSVSFDNTKSSVILNNGTLIRFSYTNQTCGGSNICGYAEFDVNGLSPPNTIGRDIFGVNIYDSKIQAYGSNKPDNTADGNTTSCSTSGWGCSTDYLYK